MTWGREHQGARLSVQRGLLGVVSPSLYAGCLELTEDLITLTWYVASDMSEDEREDLSIVGTEVIAGMPHQFLIDEKIIDVPDVAEPVERVGTWVLVQRGVKTREPH